MKAKPAPPERVRSMEGLGVTDLLRLCVFRLLCVDSIMARLAQCKQFKHEFLADVFIAGVMRKNSLAFKTPFTEVVRTPEDFGSNIRPLLRLKVLVVPLSKFRTLKFFLGRVPADDLVGTFLSFRMVVLGKFLRERWWLDSTILGQSFIV